MQVLLIETIGVLGLFIILFTYNAIATDLLTTFYSFAIYLLFLLPFMIFMTELKISVDFLNLGDLLFFKAFFHYATMICFFVGMYLFFSLFYLCFFA